MNAFEIIPLSYFSIIRSVTNSFRNRNTLLNSERSRNFFMLSTYFQRAKQFIHIMTLSFMSRSFDCFASLRANILALFIVGSPTYLFIVIFALLPVFSFKCGIAFLLAIL